MPARMELVALLASWGILLTAGCALVVVDHLRARSLRLRERLLRTREHELRAIARDLIAASRESTIAVCRVLDQAVRAYAPSVDAVLFFERDGDELRCTHAHGNRVEYFREARLSLERDDSAVTHAALQRHRITSRGGRRPVAPGDRAFLAIPMVDAAETIGVLYAATLTSSAVEAEESIITLVELAVSAYQLARDREIDHARATIDALTALLTPAAFRTRLAEALAHPTIHRSALLFIDADNFKLVNDTLGHHAGDVILRTLANVLSAGAGPYSLVGRNGGDEFCMVFLGASKTEAIQRAEEIRKAVQAHPFEELLEGKRLVRPITASIGVAAFPGDAETATALLKAADEAMYHSKQRGRNRVSFYDAAGVLADLVLAPPSQ